MTIYADLRKILSNHGITTDYTDAELDGFIMEAKLLIDVPCVNNSQFEDYIKEFTGDIYCTNEYPIIESSVEILIDNERVHPEHITQDGIIYFDKEYDGTLQCSYIVGLSVDDINNYLLPIVACIIEEKEGLNVSSISEGDVSISYNNTTGYTSTTLDALIQNLKDKYGARVRLI